MKIAIVHYHLRRGGVTQVIATAIESLKKFGHEIVVLSGERPSPEIAAKIPCWELTSSRLRETCKLVIDIMNDGG